MSALRRSESPAAAWPAKARVAVATRHSSAPTPSRARVGRGTTTSTSASSRISRTIQACPKPVPPRMVSARELNPGVAAPGKAGNPAASPPSQSTAEISARMAPDIIAARYRAATASTRFAGTTKAQNANPPAVRSIAA